jgi:hypothetical protein
MTEVTTSPVSLTTSTEPSSLTVMSCLSRDVHHEMTQMIPESGVIVGNGSKAKCLIGYYDWEYMKKKGRSATLKRLVISDVVEYTQEVEEMDAL